MYVKSFLRRLMLLRKTQSASNQYWHALESYNYQQVFPQRHKCQVDFTRQHLVARMKPSDLVVDLGCGDGWHSMELAPYCQKLQGYDFSKNLVVLANQAAKDQGFSERCQFEVADVLKLELPEISADVVLLCGLMTCLINDSDAMCAARLAASTVKPGGYVLYKDTLHQGKGTRLNHMDTYGAVYRDREQYLSLIRRSGVGPITDSWIDATGEYGSLMVIAQKPPAQ